MHKKSRVNRGFFISVNSKGRKHPIEQYSDFPVKPKSMGVPPIEAKASFGF